MDEEVGHAVDACLMVSIQPAARFVQANETSTGLVHQFELSSNLQICNLYDKYEPCNLVVAPDPFCVTTQKF